MQFEWDEAKRAENIAKHRIDFADVSEMFDLPMLTELDRVLTMGRIVGLGSGFCKMVSRLLSGQKGRMI